MTFWSVTIPTRTTHGTPGSHMFIVNADRYEDARNHALTQADLPKSRRHRRNAALNIQALAVTELTARWGL
ncbi:hypothetical protein OG905_00885 [Streptomyces sp. NBC_00322]|uniref:hypothetical protein n=1 Tax=Streptomyces sp. NBC_00322 TaxID=2975712 RepID=UPI002E2DBF76|nr:hypothetical protein [Streptomyces sp. NBC_00322]